jgi:hypothetical protein
MAAELSQFAGRIVEPRHPQQGCHDADHRESETGMAIGDRTRRAMVLIAHFGALPEWFDIWLHTAKLNRGIDFYLYQEVIESCQDGNVFFNKLTLEDFNSLPLLRSEGCAIRNPYKFCDYKPLIAEAFPRVVSSYEYWGWGDLDVIYGDILSVVGPSFDRRFDYVSTGWQGESGPLGFLKNSEQVNTLWRLLPDVHSQLNNEKYLGIDEPQFVSLLKAYSFSCDIVFRECLFDLPARWKDGELRSLRTDKEYALYHFGAPLGNRSEMIRKSRRIIDHLRAGGTIRISKKYCRSRRQIIRHVIVPVIGTKYSVTREYKLHDIVRACTEKLSALSESWKQRSIT